MVKKKKKAKDLRQILSESLEHLPYSIARIIMVAAVTGLINLAAHYTTENKNVDTVISAIAGAGASMVRTKKV